MLLKLSEMDVYLIFRIAQVRSFLMEYFILNVDIRNIEMKIRSTNLRIAELY